METEFGLEPLEAVGRVPGARSCGLQALWLSFCLRQHLLYAIYTISIEVIQLCPRKLNQKHTIL